MTLVDVVAVLVLFLKLVSGFREGAVKNFFSLLSFIIALLFTGAGYRYVAGVLSFLPGKDWENVAGFLVTLAITSVLMSFVFLAPRRLIEKIWKGGCLFRLAGAGLNVLNGSIGLVVFAIVIVTYPVFQWLAQAVVESSVLVWLVVHLGFVRALLPAEFWGTASAMVMALMGIC